MAGLFCCFLDYEYQLLTGYVDAEQHVTENLLQDVWSFSLCWLQFSLVWQGPNVQSTPVAHCIFKPTIHQIWYVFLLSTAKDTVRDSLFGQVHIKTSPRQKKHRYYQQLISNIVSQFLLYIYIFDK